MKRVLALQHVWDDPAGYLGELLQEYRIAYDVVHVETESLPDPTRYGAVLAFGGFQHANDDDKYPYFVQERVYQDIKRSSNGTRIPSISRQVQNS